MFDPASFMNTAYTEAASTESIPVPEGEYVGFITKLAPKTVEVQGEQRVIVDLTWEVPDNDGSIKTVTGRDKNFVRQSLWLDTLPNGSLDLSKGMNVQLGLTREGLGQNDPAKPWTFNHMLNIPAKILVVHRTNDKDGKIYADVKKVTKL